MGRRKKTKEGFFLGWTPLLYSVEIVFIAGKGRQEKGWSEAYGYLGSYHKTQHDAQYEINFLMRQFPEKYTHWAIEQIVLDEDGFRQHDNEMDSVIVAHSDGAPFDTGENATAPDPTGGAA